MAPKAMKRAASKSAGGARKKSATASVKKGCSKIQPAIKAADSIPQSVRSIIAPALVHVFGTYKEERHEFQTHVSEFVGKILETTKAKLEAAISEAENSKAAADGEGTAKTEVLTGKADAAKEASAATAAAKAALDGCTADLRGAKNELQDAEAAVKKLAADETITGTKKEKLESLTKEFFAKVKSGELTKGLTKSADYAGKFLKSNFENELEKEFLGCVVKSYSKEATSWGTFDKIVQAELDEKLAEFAANLTNEIATMAGNKEPTAARVETAKTGVTAAEEKLKGAQEAYNGALAAEKAAKAEEKAAAAGVKSQAANISKAADTLKAAQDELEKFQKGALAAYAEVEDNKPPPAPVVPEPAEAEAAEELDQAMTAAMPAPEGASASPSILPSPGVFIQRVASGIASRVSPGVQTTPRVAAD